MSETTTTHDTITVRETYKASAERVFRAWQDPAALQRWYVPGDAGWSSEILTHDFRVGGAKLIAFGPQGGQRYTEDCRYVDIVNNRRICFSMLIMRGETRITASMVTVELLKRPAGTEVVTTDQLTILDGGETPDDRERGWSEVLQKLAKEIATTS